MKIAIFCQEEAVYFSPFLRAIVEARPDEVALLVIAGGRGAGSHPKTMRQKLENMLILWLIMEPSGFFRNLLIGIRQRCIRCLGLTATCFDKRSVRGAARRHGIPILESNDLNSSEFLEQLRSHAPDVVINQTEFLLKEEVCSAPRLGIVNRHASLLPNFRGRLGSWRSHAATPPEYGVTIHFVDKGIDSGPIICQRNYTIDPRSSYTHVLDVLFADAPALMLEALDKLRDPNFVPTANLHQGTPTYLFPNLREAREYRSMLKNRRRS